MLSCNCYVAEVVWVDFYYEESLYYCLPNESLTAIPENVMAMLLRVSPGKTSPFLLVSVVCLYMPLIFIAVCIKLDGEISFLIRDNLLVEHAVSGTPCVW